MKVGKSHKEKQSNHNINVVPSLCKKSFQWKKRSKTIKWFHNVLLLTAWFTTPRQSFQLSLVSLPELPHEFWVSKGAILWTVKRRHAQPHLWLVLQEGVIPTLADTWLPRRIKTKISGGHGGGRRHAFLKRKAFGTLWRWGERIELSSSAQAPHGHKRDFASSIQKLYVKPTSRPEFCPIPEHKRNCVIPPGRTGDWGSSFGIRKSRSLPLLPFTGRLVISATHPRSPAAESASRPCPPPWAGLSRADTGSLLSAHPPSPWWGMPRGGHGLPPRGCWLVTGARRDGGGEWPGSPSAQGRCARTWCWGWGKSGDEGPLRSWALGGSSPHWTSCKQRRGYEHISYRSVVLRKRSGSCFYSRNDNMLLFLYPVT